MRTVLILARSCRSCCRKNVNFKIPVLAPIFLRQFTLSVPAVISKESSAPCGQWPMPMGRSAPQLKVATIRGNIRHRLTEIFC